MAALDELLVCEQSQAIETNRSYNYETFTESIALYFTVTC